MAALKNFTEGLSHKDAVVLSTEAPSTMFFITTRLGAKPLLARMKAGMNKMISQIKVFYSIIDDITIKVMNCFIGLKIPPKVFFHYKSMFKNISISFDKGMIESSNQNISPSVFRFTTLPVRSYFPPKTKSCLSILFLDFRSPNIFAFSHFTNLLYNFNRDMSNFPIARKKVN